MKNCLECLKTVKLSTWIRTALMIVAVINMVLEMFGKNILPISNEQISEIITYIFTIVVFIVNWWKNNSFTTAAQKADEILCNKSEALTETEGEE